MAVLSFDLVTETENDTGSDVEVVSTYEVRVSDPETAQIDMKRARPNLLRYNPHPKNGQFRLPVFVTRWSSINDDRDPCLFIVTVEYSFGSGENPKQSRFEMGTPTWRTTYKQELIFKSPNTGQPFQNTAGDPLAGITEDKPYWTLNYSWSARSRPRWIKEYAAAINSDDIRLDGDNFGKYQVLMGELEIAPEVDEDGIEYRRLMLQIITHPEKEGWIREFPNVGYYELTKRIYSRYVTGVPQTLLRESGRYRIEDDAGDVERPAWLGPNGSAIREKYDPNNKRHADITKLPLKMPLDDKDFIWIKCDTRKKLPFGPLGLK